jgi:cyanophycinase
MSDRTPATVIETLSPPYSDPWLPLLQPKFDLFGAECRSDKLTVMAIGGAEDKIQDRLILRTFVKLSGGAQAKILLIPMASEEPLVKGEIYGGLFADLGAASTQVLLVDDRPSGESPDLIQQLDDCTGVFISGGDQSRLCGLLGGTPLAEQLRQRVYQGQIVLAGTSAGAAILGHHMIACGGSGEAPNHGLVELETGFSILPGAIVDQHFHNRNRLARLISAIAPHPQAIGLGIDEDTCAIVNGQGQIQVIGKGAVTILQATHSCKTNGLNGLIPAEPQPLSLYNLQLHLMRHGDVYDLASWQADDLPASHWLDR